MFFSFLDTPVEGAHGGGGFLWCEHAEMVGSAPGGVGLVFGALGNVPVLHPRGALTGPKGSHEQTIA